MENYRNYLYFFICSFSEANILVNSYLVHLTLNCLLRNNFLIKNVSKVKEKLSFFFQFFHVHLIRKKDLKTFFLHYYFLS